MARVIFELGDKPSPKLYADVTDCLYTDRIGETRVFDPSEDALSALVGSVVSETSTDGGALRLTFADGSALSCAPIATYEAWQVVGGSPQYLVVGSPVGEELLVGDTSSPAMRPDEVEAFLANLKPPE
jgi:hypothetical protein